MVLSSRQQQLLAAIVEEYTKSCEPVGSKLLATHGDFALSPATIRNEMADLETAGMIVAPHPSAGRVPTEAGYQYYVETALREYQLSPRERQALRGVNTADDVRQQLKTVAKNLAEASASCILVGFSAREVYYTGLANLFAQPEFHDHRFRCSMSEVIDHLDEVMAEVYPQFQGHAEVQILIGRNNPFGDRCSVLVTGYVSRTAGSGLLGMLGPMRMDYRRNRALLAYVQPFAVRE